MGCDIHLRAEYLGREETVVLNEGEIAVTSEGPMRWLPAEKLTPKEEDPDYDFYRSEKGRQYVEEYEKLPLLNLSYKDRFYGGRDYELFGRLAGVRRDDDQYWEDRGFPDDASPEVTEEFESWGADAHTPSWQTLEELVSKNWIGAHESGSYVNQAWMECLEKLKDVAVDKCDGDYSRVRIVYYFDN